MRYIIQVKETGDELEETATLKEAIEIYNQYIEEDGDSEDEYYEIKEIKDNGDYTIVY